MLCVLQCINTVYGSSARSGCNEWEWANVEVRPKLGILTNRACHLFCFFIIVVVCWVLHNPPCWK
ncbi:hypothetical protein I7I48_07229 [Histoplasma ohiense]|nr:hypothetical protein I7I48_07229 [Histoplasma ohiense (nom. inval.)]